MKRLNIYTYTLFYPFLWIFLLAHAYAGTYTCAKPQNFEVAYTNNTPGNIKLIGNTNICKKENGVCVDPGTATNNSIAAEYKDGDTVTSTKNSSAAKLELPDNAEILWAGMYWQGYFDESKMNNPLTDTIKDKSKSIKIGFSPDGAAPPNRNVAYSTVTADKLNWVYFKKERWYYQGFAEVTDYVKKRGKGWYWGADINLQVGTKVAGGSLGAWSIAIAYRDTNDTVKNLTVYQGYLAFAGNTDVANALTYAQNNGCDTSFTGVQKQTNVTLSGFKTPKEGTIDSRFIFFGGEGDIGLTGDSISVSDKSGLPHLLSDAANPATNAINSSISDFGVHRNSSLLYPRYGKNTIGIDIDTFDTSAILNHDQQNTNIRLGTIGDGYFPGGFGLSTELFVPKLCYDYDVRVGDHIKIPSDNRTVETNAWDDDLTLTLLIRSEISDFPIDNSKLNVTFTPNTLHYVKNGSKVSAPDTNIYTPIKDIDSSKGQIGIGRGSQALLESDGGIIGAHETVFAKQRFAFGTLSSYKGVFNITIEGTIQFDPSAQPVSYTLSTGAPSNSPNYIPQCGSNPVYDPIWANFNIERTDSYQYSDPKKKYPLYTQIAGKPFSVSVTSYTKGSSGEYTVPFDTNASVELEIIDASIFDNNRSAGFDSTCSEPTAQAQGAFLSFFKNGKKNNRIDVNIPADIPSFNNDIALQNAAFRLWVLAVKESNGTKRIIPHSCKLDNSTPGCFKSLYQSEIKPYDSNATLGIHCQTACSGSNSDQTCYTCLKDYFATPICSRDNFSIRPESFRVQLADSNETNGTAGKALTVNNKKNGKLNANLALSAGYKYRADINATLFNDTGRAGAYYNESFKAKSNLGSLGNKTDHNTIAALEFDDNAACNDQTHRSYKMRFQNGSVDKNTYISHNNAGNYRFWMLDSNWTKVDRGDYIYKTRFGDCKVNDSRKECTDCDTSNPSSSSRNSDGKLGCVINSNVNDTNNGDLYVEVPLNFEPYSFGLNTVQFKKIPNRNILFMNDFNQSGYYGSVLSSKLSMSATFDGNVTAQGKQNTILTNFTDNCSASDVTLDIQRVMNPSEANLTLLNNVKFQQYLEVGLNVVDKQEGNNTTLTLPKAAFQDSYKGHAPMKLHSTIKKPYGFGNKINPVQVDYQLLKATGYDANSSADMSTHIPDGNLSVDQNITYVYGKVTPMRRLYEDVQSSSIQTPLYVDIFCDESAPGSTLNPNDCKNLFNLDKNSLGKEESESGWKQATIFANNELGTADLAVSHFAERFADPYISVDGGGKNKNITAMVFNDNNASQNDINVSVAGSARNSMVQVTFTPVPWLIYDPLQDFYRVHFISPGVWAGVGKTGHVTNSSSSDTQNNRMSW